jgi:hypothetical protein
MNSDTYSKNIRTVFRDIRTVVGAERRSASTLKQVSELGQVFPFVQRRLFGAESDVSPRRTT